jgi:glyoxylase-like metal-dependent hydrolase (beta-lactamase superfamily II)
MPATRLHVLKTGVLPQDKAILIAGFSLATENNRQPKHVWSLTPTYAVYIEHPDGDVLFDTSVNPLAMRERFTPAFRELNPYVAKPEEEFPARFAALGVPPEAVKTIVLSHLHFDHAGNLEMFPGAEIIVHEDEFTQAMRLFGLNGDMGIYVWEDLNQAIRKKLKWNLFPRAVPERVIRPGITVYNLGPGHSYGMLALLVELPRTGNILLVADAVYTAINFGPPLRPPSIIYDSIGWASSLERIRELAAAKQAQVWFGHDQEQLSKLISSDQGCYE